MLRTLPAGISVLLLSSCGLLIPSPSVTEEIAIAKTVEVNGLLIDITQVDILQDQAIAVHLSIENQNNESTSLPVMFADAVVGRSQLSVNSALSTGEFPISIQPGVVLDGALYFEGEFEPPVDSVLLNLGNSRVGDGELIPFEIMLEF